MGAHRAQKVDTGLHDWNVREDRAQKERENVASEAAQWRRGFTPRTEAHIQQSVDAQP